jgi:hypothetical protein
MVLLRTIGIWMMMATALALQAQEAAFYASVDKNAVAMDGFVRFDLTVENGDFNELKPPAFADFDLLNTSQSTSTNVTIVQGRQQIVRRTTRSFWLKPRKEGSLTIESASVRIAGKVYESKPIKINVGAGGAPPPSPSDPSLPNENVFVRAMLSKSKVYVGEQLQLSYKIYTRQGITNYSEPQAAMPGFWREDIRVANPPVQTETINGIQYRTAIIKRVILIPQQSGTLDIPAAEMTADLEAGWFRTQRITLKSNAFKLEVQPLPPGKPDAFTGTVGKLALNSRISSDSAAVDEAITLTLTLSGTANLKLLELPPPDLPRDFEVYDPKVSQNISNTGGAISGSKTYEYLIIPRQPGTFRLTPLRFAYFDAEAKAYRTLSTPEYTFVITGTASQGGTGTITGISKEDIELLGQDIRYIMTGTPAWVQHSGRFIGSPAFLALAGAPLLLLFLLTAWRRKQAEARGDMARMRQRRALKEANRILAKAAKSQRNGKPSEVFDLVRDAIWHYAAGRLHMPVQEHQRQFLEARLKGHGIPEAPVRELASILDTCDMALYAPSAVQGDAETMPGRARKALADIEKQLPA